MTDRGGRQLIPRPSDVRSGVPAPWATLPPAERAVTLDAVRAAFTGRVGAPSVVEGSETVRASAVLAALWEHEGEVEVLLTRRSQGMRAHSGEIAFPGGRSEPGESMAEAALREAAEEVALPPAGVEVLGELDHLTTVTSRSFIVPLVAVLPGRPSGLVPNPAEVEDIRFVTASELLADGVYREERWVFDAPPWASPGLHDGDLRPVERSIFFFELEGDTVWGATAAMLRQLLALVVGIAAAIEHD